MNLSIKSYRNPPRYNAMKVNIGPIEVWFSYSTPVAFRLIGNPIVVRENEWGPTTGSHLNMIDGGSYNKEMRVSGEKFEEMFGNTMMLMTMGNHEC